MSNLIVHRRLALSCLVAILAGAFATLALPPYGFWSVLLLAFPVLVWLLDGAAERRSFRRGFAIGWCFGFGYFVPSLWWISEAFRVEPEKFAALIPFAVAGLPAYLAVYWGLACGLAVRLWDTGWRRVVLLACLLTIAEWLRGNLLTGFPWNLPGYAASPLDGLSQFASIAGIYALTLVLVIATAAPASLWQPGRPGGSLLKSGGVFTLLVMSAIGMVHLWGNQRIAAYDAAQASLPEGEVQLVRIVQPSVPQNIKWDRDRRDGIVATYLEMTARPWPEGMTNPPLVLWPESALPLLLGEDDALRQRVAGLLPQGSFLLTGGLHRLTGSDGVQRIFNSLLVVGPQGRILGRHDKVRLVPFGEFLPFPWLLEPLGIRQLARLPQGFSEGREDRVVSIAGLPAFAGFICYEAVFPRSWPRKNPPKLLVNVTNDAWFGTSGGPHQHLAQARFRAIEQGAPMLRAANTGISAVIDSIGRVTASQALFAKANLEATIPVAMNTTPYARYGDGILAVVLFSLLTGVLICRLNNLQ